jgi:hypothetical protein
MKTLKFNDTEVKLSFESYRNNGTLAVEMITVPDEDLYAVITVNLCCPLQTDRLAFVDENNLPGIGAVGTVLIGILVFKEPASFWRLLFITTLIASVVGLKILS